MTHPSLFNDVLGPVMRGPSSSHSAAANRIGLLARKLIGGTVARVVVSFDTNGSLATTHENQGSDMGLFGGLLGWDCRDERLVDAPAVLKRQANVEVRIGTLGFTHPNTYHLELHKGPLTHTFVAVSTGGGMIEVRSIDGFEVSITGDRHSTLVFLKHDGKAPTDSLNNTECQTDLLQGPNGRCLHIISLGALDTEIVQALNEHESVVEVAILPPVLPVLTPFTMQVPFSTHAEMLQHAAGSALSFQELALAYESARGGVSHERVRKNMLELIALWRTSIAQGMAGTRYEDRILGSQSPTFAARAKAGKLADIGALNGIIARVSALMEVKSAMGLIIAAPTAGACAALPGTLIGLADHMGLDDHAVARGLLAAGLIGVFIARRSTFAAEVAGCQAECGSASGMAAAGVAEMMGGNREQAAAAASMALQNVLGMVCDPVANRVEVPCLGKNVLAAANALSAANMALADYDPVLPLDEVIDTMDSVGKAIPHELRCTALGGLSQTTTSQRIRRQLKT